MELPNTLSVLMIGVKGIAKFNNNFFLHPFHLYYWKGNNRIELNKEDTICGE